MNKLLNLVKVISAFHPLSTEHHAVILFIIEPYHTVNEGSNILVLFLGELDIVTKPKTSKI